MAFSFRAGTNWCHDFPKLARESGFYFSMHRTKVRVDWNRISTIDIDRVVRERDFFTVDENVNNVIDYCLESEYDVKILDPNFVKLFRLAQLAVEYLLYCKQYLDHSVIILKDELKLKIEENIKLKKSVASSEDSVKELTEKLKERDKLMEMKANDSHGELHQCPHCTKAFISAMYVSAHIARRHPNASTRFPTASPVHEQYRAETEKLHDEIKMLKERLNQTERVIRCESDKTIGGDERMGGRYERGEHRSNREREDRMDEQHRKYQEEIASLKHMLFSEIRNLKQRDTDMSPAKRHENDSFGAGVKELVRQQEMEILRLKSQMHERVTPDLESVQEKLHAQENYWKSKIEHIENQHRLDTESLSNQLRLTQEMANRIKVEYESKVNNLERQSYDQSKMLTAQSEQLSHLSRGVQNSRKSDPRDNVVSEDVQYVSNNASKKYEAFNGDARQYGSDKMHLRKMENNALVEDVGSVSSHESPKKFRQSAGRKQFLRDEPNSRDALETRESNDERRNDRQVRPRESSNRFRKQGASAPLKVPREKSTVENRVLDSLKSTQGEDIVENKEDTVEAFRLSGEKQSQRSTKAKSNSDRYNPIRVTYARVSSPRNTFKSTKLSRETEKAPKALSNLHKNAKIDDAKREAAGNLENNQALSTESDGSELCSETESESGESDCASKTDSQSGSTEDDSSQRNANDDAKRNSPVSARDSRERVLELFESKLHDLGIDPEWKGIPKATFKQKMETVKHRQNINSKKYPKYDSIKHQIIREISHRLSLKRKEPEGTSEKRSPFSKLLTNVKAKAIGAFNNQNNRDNRTSELKSEVTTLREVIPKQKPYLHTLPKKMCRSEHRELNRGSSQNDLSKQTNSERSPALSSYYKSDTNEKKALEKISEPSTGLRQISQSYGSMKQFLQDHKNTSNSFKSRFEMAGAKVTSTPKRNTANVMQESFTSNTDESESRVAKQERARSLPASPKNNKSMLKSATGSVGSLVKKKVLFDLEKGSESPEKSPASQQSLGKFYPESDLEKKESNDEDCSISSISDEKEQTREEKKSVVAESITLKTSQSDKIAQISRKIEEQLSVSRMKPVGAIEAMFLAKSSKVDDQKNGIQYPSSTSITSSILESPSARRQTTSTAVKDKLPQPAPRSSRSKNSSLPGLRNDISKVKDSELESDIEELLQME